MQRRQNPQDEAWVSRPRANAMFDPTQKATGQEIPVAKNLATAGHDTGQATAVEAARSFNAIKIHISERSNSYIGGGVARHRAGYLQRLWSAPIDL
jgi:hypothetical protein